MVETTALYRRCLAVYNKLSHRVIGEHGQQRRTHVEVEGDVIGAFLPRQMWPVMELNTDADPTKQYFALNMPVKDSKVNVFAVPSAWAHRQSIQGATEAEVVTFLIAIERRLNSGPRINPTPRYK